MHGIRGAFDVQLIEVGHRHDKCPAIGRHHEERQQTIEVEALNSWRRCLQDWVVGVRCYVAQRVLVRVDKFVNDSLKIRVVSLVLGVEDNIFIRFRDFPKELNEECFILPVLDKTVSAFLAYYDDNPVATSLIYYAGNTSGIYSVTTLPEYRGKGIGSYMTYLPMIEAKTKGYLISTLHASDMGYNMYKKMGYKKYSEIEFYSYKI